MRQPGAAMAACVMLALAACETNTLSAQGPAAPFGALPAGDPSSTVKLTEVAAELMEAGYVEAALKTYRRSLIDEGVSQTALMGLGAANFQLGRVRQARRHMERAVDLDPSAPLPRINLGVILYTLRDYPGARAAFTEAQQIAGDPDGEIARNLVLVDIAEERATNAPTAVVQSDYVVVPHGHGRYVLAPHKPPSDDGPSKETPTS